MAKELEAMSIKKIEHRKYFGLSNFPIDRNGVFSEVILEDWIKEVGITDYRFEYSSVVENVILSVSFGKESDYQLCCLTWL